MKAYETKVSRPFRMNIAKIVTSSPSIRQSLQVCHVNAMEYDGLWMNAFQTGSGAQRRSHGAAFSGPGYLDDADDGGAGRARGHCGHVWPRGPLILTLQLTM